MASEKQVGRPGLTFHSGSKGTPADKKGAGRTPSSRRVEKLPDDLSDSEPSVLRIHRSTGARVDGKHVRSRTVDSQHAAPGNEPGKAAAIRQQLASLLEALKTSATTKSLRADYERGLRTIVRTADPLQRIASAHLRVALEELVGAYAPLAQHRPGERIFDQMLKTLFMVMGGPDMLDQDRDAILYLVPLLGQGASEVLRKNMQQRILTLLGATLGIGGMPDKHKLPVMNGLVVAAPSAVTRESSAYADRLRHAIVQTCPPGKPAPLTRIAPALDTAAMTLQPPVLALVSMAQVGAMAQIKGHADAPAHALRHLLTTAQGAESPAERMAFLCLGAAVQCQEGGHEHMLTSLVQALATMSSRVKPSDMQAMGLAVAMSGVSREDMRECLKSLRSTVPAERLRSVSEAFASADPLAGSGDPLCASLRSTSNVLRKQRLGLEPLVPPPQDRKPELVETKASRDPSPDPYAGDPVLASKFRQCLASLHAQIRPDPDSANTPASAEVLGDMFALALGRDLDLQLPLKGNQFSQLLFQLFKAWGVLTNHGQDLSAFEAMLDRLLYAAGGAAMPQRERQIIVDSLEDFRADQLQGAQKDVATINRLEAIRFSLEKGQPAKPLPVPPQEADGAVPQWADHAKEFVLAWSTPQDAGSRMTLIGDAVARHLAQAPATLLCSAAMGLVAGAMERGDVAANGVRDMQASCITDAMRAMLSRLGKGRGAEDRLAHACLGASVVCKTPPMRDGLLDAMAEATRGMTDSQVRAMVLGYTGARMTPALMTAWARRRLEAGRDDKDGAQAHGVNRLLGAYKSVSSEKLARRDPLRESVDRTAAQIGAFAMNQSERRTRVSGTPPRRG